jgi:hypothetical protein
MNEITTEFCVNCGAGVKGRCMGCSHDGSPECDCVYCASKGADRAANYEQPFYDLSDNCLVVRRMLDGDVYLEADSLLRFPPKMWAQIVEFSTKPMPAIPAPTVTN